MLSKFVVNLEGIQVLVDFEFIQIVDNTDPYPALLGLDWAIDMDGVINLKRRMMKFNNIGVSFIIPLDPAKGQRYIERVRTEDKFDQIYKLNLCEEDWINPMTDGNIK